MYKVIPGLKIGQLTNATHSRFMEEVATGARESLGVQMYFPLLFAEFRSALDDEQAALRESQKSALTPEIAKKDDARDSSLAAAKAFLRAACWSSDEEARAAAMFLKNMTNLLKIKAKMQYDQQSGEIEEVCSELLEIYAEKTEKSGIRPYIENLKRQNDEMRELLARRDEQRGEQGPSRVAECRKKTDNVYREIIRAVNACELVFSLGKLSDQPADDPFDTFFNLMLGAIDRYKHEVMVKRHRKKLEVLEEEETVESTEKEEVRKSL